MEVATHITRGGILGMTSHHKVIGIFSSAVPVSEEKLSSWSFLAMSVRLIDGAAYCAD